MRILKQLVSSLALLLSVTVVLFGCDGDKGTNPGGGGNNTGGNSTGGGSGNKCGVDGTAKSCKTVEIGGQTWFAENLNRKTDSSWCYNDADSNCAKYGRLYTWNAAKKACPSGWKLPDTADWGLLIDKAGGYSTAGTKLKSSSGWNNFAGELIVGTDYYGFSALPGGGGGNTYGGAGLYGYWWTSTEGYSNYAYRLSMHYSSEKVYSDESSMIGSRNSVRCIKN